MREITYLLMSIFLFVLFSCGNVTEKDDSAKSKKDTIAIDTSKKKDEVKKNNTSTNVPKVINDTIKNTKTTNAANNKTAISNKSETKTTSTVIPNTNKTTTTTETKVLICVSSTAAKYHKYQCRGLSKCTHEIKEVTKSEAISMGYTACKICY